MLARFISIPFRKWLEAQIEKTGLDAKLSVIKRALLPLITPIIWVILLWIAVAIAERLMLRDKLLSVVVGLVNAWIVIRLITQFVREQVWDRFIAVLVWAIAALNIVGLLQPSLSLLDSIALKIGQIRISALGVLEGLFYLVLLL